MLDRTQQQPDHHPLASQLGGNHAISSPTYQMLTSAGGILAQAIEQPQGMPRTEPFRLLPRRATRRRARPSTLGTTHGGDARASPHPPPSWPDVSNSPPKRRNSLLNKKLFYQMVPWLPGGRRLETSLQASF